MGNGQLFLPVKAAIRKKIKKEEGDWVRIILFEEKDPEEVPEEFILCLKDDPDAWKNFQQFSKKEKKKYTDWIYSAKTDEVKIERLAVAVNEIRYGKKE